MSLGISKVENENLIEKENDNFKKKVCWCFSIEFF